MPDQSDAPLRLREAYASVYNEITQPDKVFVASQYFRRKWVPRLGTTLAWVVIALRQHCYSNRVTGEKRDWCMVTQDELAREAGISVSTLKRSLEHADAHRFIIEVKHRYRYDQTLCKQVRTDSRYRILMDDPLIPEDEERFRALLTERLAGLNIDPETGQTDLLQLLDRLMASGSDLPVNLSGSTSEPAAPPKKRGKSAAITGSPASPADAVRQGPGGQPSLSSKRGKLPRALSTALPLGSGSSDDIREQLPLAASPIEGPSADIKQLQPALDSRSVPVGGNDEGPEGGPVDGAVVGPANGPVDPSILTREQLAELSLPPDQLLQAHPQGFRPLSISQAARQDVAEGITGFNDTYFYSVPHALGEGGDEWLPDEDARIERLAILKRELAERQQRLGALSLEEALQRYYQPNLARQLLAGRAPAERNRIERWVTYTRRAGGLRNPAGFLRQKIESGEECIMAA
jgi:hypothetical protein